MTIPKAVPSPYVDPAHVKALFSLLNETGVRYLLLKNIEEELPSALKLTKDIDILVLPEDRERLAAILEEKGYAHVPHPKREERRMEGLDPFDLYVWEDILLDVCYQLCCHGLDPHEWRAFGKEMQDSLWGNAVYDARCRCYRLGEEEELIYLLARAVFDKRGFQRSYIKRIGELLTRVEQQRVSGRLEWIFPGYAGRLLEAAGNGQFEGLAEAYFQYASCLGEN